LTGKKWGDEIELIQCRVCNKENYKFLSTCKDCGVRLRKAVARNGAKKKNKKKIEFKKRKKEMAKCRGNKQTYSTKKDAVKVSRAIFIKKGRMSMIYRCKSCQGFHLTKLISR